MLPTAVFAAGALLGALLTPGTPAAWADFRETRTARAELGADVLQPPSGLSASSERCGQVGARIDLQWTASGTAWLGRYDVLLATSAAGPYSLVPPAGGQSPTATTRWVDGLDRKRTYHVVVRSVRGSWWSATSPVSVQTPNIRC